MTASIHALETKIDRLLSRTESADSQVKGLRIRVSANGAKSFVLRKRVGDKVVNILIGNSASGVDIDQARGAASGISEFLSNFNSELRQQSPTPHTTTFEELFVQFRREKEGQRSWPEIKRIFSRHILPRFGQREITRVRRSEISQLIVDVAWSSDPPVPAMGRAVAAQISSFYSWAMRRIDDLETNPCKYITRPSRAASRDRILSEGELAQLWTILGTEGLPWEPAIKLLILTGQRRNEVFGACWSEFDLDASLWTIPANRTKNAKTQLVPLAPSAAKIISTLPSRGRREMLFPSKTNQKTSISGFSKAMTRIRTKMCERFGEFENFTLHDLRRTMATGLRQLGVRIEVTEAILNHRSGSSGGIVGVYQRHHFLSEKRDALNQWEAKVLEIVD